MNAHNEQPVFNSHWDGLLRKILTRTEYAVFNHYYTERNMERIRHRLKLSRAQCLDHLVNSMEKILFALRVAR